MSPYRDKTLQTTGILSKKDVTVVALSRQSERSYEFNPAHNALLKPGDVVILMGDINAINSIKGAVS